MDEKKLSKPSSAQSKQLGGASVDWELANTGAAAWARRYGFDLVSQITETTRARLQQEIAAFIENQENMGQLRARLEPLFGPVRAELIAATEVTRAYAEGNRQAWRESGVINQRQWFTSNDEFVCPICGPMNGLITGLDEPYQHPDGSTLDGPPAHPRCRCFEGAVVGE